MPSPPQALKSRALGSKAPCPLNFCPCCCSCHVTPDPQSSFSNLQTGIFVAPPPGRVNWGNPRKAFNAGKCWSLLPAGGPGISPASPELPLPCRWPYLGTTPPTLFQRPQNGHPVLHPPSLQWRWWWEWRVSPGTLCLAASAPIKSQYWGVPCKEEILRLGLWESSVCAGGSWPKPCAPILGPWLGWSSERTRLVFPQLGPPSTVRRHLEL